MTDRRQLPTGVPILDHGITIPRDGYSVVLLDGAAVTLADTVEGILAKMLGPWSEKQRKEEG